MARVAAGRAEFEPDHTIYRVCECLRPESVADVFPVLDQLSAAGPGVVLRAEPHEFALEVDQKGPALPGPDRCVSGFPVHDLFSKRGVERLV